MNNNNIWELAEAHIAGTLSAADAAALKARLESDAVFASEFNENINLVNSLNNSGSQKRFRTMLKDIHQEQSASGFAKLTRIIQLPANFWRTAAVAATVALLTSFISYTVLTGSAKKSDAEYSKIRREVNGISNETSKLKKIVQDSLLNKKVLLAPKSNIRNTGTGFALTNDGYFVTAYHVINDGNGDGDSVYIQSNDGVYYKAFVVNYNEQSDLAILKVERKNFQFTKGEVPYTFAGTKAALGTQIFTVGYPKEDIVYSEGYISSRNGYDGNNQQYTMELPAGHGQSGSPVIDARGNVLGILTAISSPKMANTYAVSSNALMELIENMPAGTKLRLPKKNKLAKLGREEQIVKMENYTFSIKVYKK